MFCVRQELNFYILFTYISSSKGMSWKWIWTFLQLLPIGTIHKNNFTGSIYPCAEAVIEYFPGTRSLQKSPPAAVVILWLTPCTDIVTFGSPLPSVLRTKPWTPWWTFSDIHIRDILCKTGKYCTETVLLLYLRLNSSYLFVHICFKTLQKHIIMPHSQLKA